jgi:hypothetical protein
MSERMTYFDNPQFQSSPGVSSGSNAARRPAAMLRRMFQSSPGVSSGSNVRRHAITALVQGVSILSRSLLREQPWKLLVDEFALQVSILSRSLLREQPSRGPSKCRPPNGFNPLPESPPGATSEQNEVKNLKHSVSILSRSLLREQRDPAAEVNLSASFQSSPGVSSGSNGGSLPRFRLKVGLRGDTATSIEFAGDELPRAFAEAKDSCEPLVNEVIGSGPRYTTRGFSKSMYRSFPYTVTSCSRLPGSR